MCKHTRTHTHAHMNAFLGVVYGNVLEINAVNGQWYPTQTTWCGLENCKSPMNDHLSLSLTHTHTHTHTHTRTHTRTHRHTRIKKRVQTSPCRLYNKSLSSSNVPATNPYICRTYVSVCCYMHVKSGLAHVWLLKIFRDVIRSPAKGGPVRQPRPTKNMEKPMELLSLSDPTRSTCRAEHI